MGVAPMGVGRRSRFALAHTLHAATYLRVRSTSRGNQKRLCIAKSVAVMPWCPVASCVLARASLTRGPSGITMVSSGWPLRGPWVGVCCFISRPLSWMVWRG